MKVTLGTAQNFFSFYQEYKGKELPDKIEIAWNNSEVQDDIPFLYVNGDNYHGTIDGLITSALFQYQQNINQLYAMVLHGDSKRRLTKKEVDEIQVLFTVREGSVSLSPQNIESIIKLLGKKLTGTQLTFVICLALTLYFGRDTYKVHLDAQKDIAHEQAILEVVRELTGGEKILANHKTFARKVKRIAHSADVVRINGETISSEKEQASDSSITHARLDGDYKITKIDAEKQEFLRIRVENATTGKRFTVGIATVATPNEDEMQMLYTALRKREPIPLQINARFIEERLIDAHLIFAVK